MESRYLWLLNYCYGGCMVIKLTKEELAESEQYNDFENYISEVLEDKYEFRLKDCAWMTSEDCQYDKFGF